MTFTPYSIGIAGGTGSGKGSVAKFLVDQLGGPDNVTIVAQDNYYRAQPNLSPEQRAALNYDHPDSLELDLLAKHLEQLKQGRAVEVPKYSFEHHNRLPRDQWGTAVQPKRFIIVEGILVLHDEQLRNMFDRSFYVDTPDDVRLIRRMRRDVRDRGRTYESVMAQWETTVQPMHLQFCQPSKVHADSIVPEGGENTKALELLGAWTQQQLVAA